MQTAPPVLQKHVAGPSEASAAWWLCAAYWAAQGPSGSCSPACGLRQAGRAAISMQLGCQVKAHHAG